MKVGNPRWWITIARWIVSDRLSLASTFTDTLNNDDNSDDNDDYNNDKEDKIFHRS